MVYKSEVGHHSGKTFRVDVATAFQGFLALLAAFGGFQAIQQFFEFGDIKVITFGAYLTFG
jgi:hypothetical protein